MKQSNIVKTTILSTVLSIFINLLQFNTIENMKSSISMHKYLISQEKERLNNYKNFIDEKKLNNEFKMYLEEKEKKEFEMYLEKNGIKYKPKMTTYESARNLTYFEPPKGITDF
jgi:hypothetical protein